MRHTLFPLSFAEPLQYRLESVTVEKITASYEQERNCIRTLKIYYLREENNVYLYQLLVLDFIFSDDGNAMGMLLRKAAYLFDNLIIGIDRKGKMVKIINKEQISGRWNAIREAILADVQGAAAYAFIEKIEQCITQEDQLIRFLEDDKMYGLYFNGYKKLLDTLEKQKKTEFLHPEPDRPGEIPVFIYQNNVLIEGFSEKRDGNMLIRHSLLRIG